MDLGLNGDAALVTASTSGLGLASATALAREGADVAVCGRDPDRLAAAREQLAAAGSGAVLARQADLTDPGDVSDLVAATVEQFGGLDHLVTSAGGVPSGPFLDTDDRDWYRAYDTLVMSVVWTLREAHPHLVSADAADPGGSRSNGSGGSDDADAADPGPGDRETATWTAITSTSVREAIDGLVLSNAVRRAVVGLVKTAAREFAPAMRANAVLPGPHETPRIEELIDQAIERGEYDDYESGLADWSAEVPLDRIGDPGELGDVVAMLASDRASFVTGTALPVDGGRLRS